MQTLKLSEKERDDSKVLLTLGNTFQKEFDKLRCVRTRRWRRSQDGQDRNGTDQILLRVSEIDDTFKASVLNYDQKNAALLEENEQLRGKVRPKSEKE